MVFIGDKDDALAEHSESCNCTIDWGKTKMIAVESEFFRRKVREALEIRRLKCGPSNTKGLNRDLGDYVTTNTWENLFTKVNLMKKIPTSELMTLNN